MKYLLLIALLLTTGCIQATYKQPSEVGQYKNKGIYIYVFNQETQLWDRATKETLMKTDCNKFHFFEYPKE